MSSNRTKEITAMLKAVQQQINEKIQGNKEKAKILKKKSDLLNEILIKLNDVTDPSVLKRIFGVAVAVILQKKGKLGNKNSEGDHLKDLLNQNKALIQDYFGHESVSYRELRKFAKLQLENKNAPKITVEDAEHSELEKYFGYEKVAYLNKGAWYQQMLNELTAPTQSDQKTAGPMSNVAITKHLQEVKDVSGFTPPGETVVPSFTELPRPPKLAEPTGKAEVPKNEEIPKQVNKEPEPAVQLDQQVVSKVGLVETKSVPDTKAQKAEKVYYLSLDFDSCFAWNLKPQRPSWWGNPKEDRNKAKNIERIQWIKDNQKTLIQNILLGNADLFKQVAEEMVGRDLILISLKPGESVQSKILRDAKLNKTPILVKEGNNYVIFGDAAGDGEWFKTEIKSQEDIALLSQLPFKDGKLKKELFNQQLLEILKKGHARASGGYNKLCMNVGTNRQDPYRDYWNMLLHASPSFAPVLEAAKKPLADAIQTELAEQKSEQSITLEYDRRLIVSTTTSTRQPGDTMVSTAGPSVSDQGVAAIEDLMSQPAKYIVENAREGIMSLFDNSKITMIYQQMHRARELNPGLTDFHFRDDSYANILVPLQKFFKENPDLIPEGIVLHIHHYANGITYPQDDLKAINGKGKFDAHYKETMLLLGAAAFSDPGSAISKVIAPLNTSKCERKDVEKVITEVKPYVDQIAREGHAIALNGYNKGNEGRFDANLFRIAQKLTAMLPSPKVEYHASPARSMFSVTSKGLRHPKPEAEPVMPPRYRSPS